VDKHVLGEWYLAGLSILCYAKGDQCARKVDIGPPEAEHLIFAGSSPESHDDSEEEMGTSAFSAGVEEVCAFILTQVHLTRPLGSRSFERYCIGDIWSQCHSRTAFVKICEMTAK
jgi:hypothetical protein